MHETGSFNYVVSKKRRRRNLLTTTFLPVDGKADGRITCREQEEEEKDKEIRRGTKKKVQ